jgi:hypothetical protein
MARSAAGFRRCCGAAILVFGAFAAGTSTAARRSATAGVELEGTYALSGAVSKHGSFMDPELVRTSCAQIGKEGTGAAYVGGPNAFVVPGPPPAANGAANVSFTASVLYKGPGTFSKAQLEKGGGTNVIVGKGFYNAVAPKATATMIVKSNGSGSFVFENAAPVKKGATLDGKISWTCT